MKSGENIAGCHWEPRCFPECSSGGSLVCFRFLQNNLLQLCSRFMAVTLATRRSAYRHTPVGVPSQRLCYFGNQRLKTSGMLICSLATHCKHNDQPLRSVGAHYEDPFNIASPAGTRDQREHRIPQSCLPLTYPLERGRQIICELSGGCHHDMNRSDDGRPSTAAAR